jgi:hypothetical protein
MFHILPTILVGTVFGDGARAFTGRVRHSVDGVHPSHNAYLHWRMLSCTIDVLPVKITDSSVSLMLSSVLSQSAKVAVT